MIVAYAPFGLALGAALAATGLHPLVAWSSSPLLFGGAAQLLAVQLPARLETCSPAPAALASAARQPAIIVADRGTTTGTGRDARDHDQAVSQADPRTGRSSADGREGLSAAEYGLAMAIDPRAASGFAAVADAYQRGRPSYPTEAVDRIVEYLPLTEASRVLDLAAGTGQLSRLLRERVGHLTAVEPSPPMRAKISADVPEASVLDGTAESIPLANAVVEAVVVGEAFHWFQSAAATAEIARVLTEHGGLALLWNSATWSSDDTPWLEDFRSIVRDHKQAAGGYPAGNGAWQEAFENTGLFAPLVHSQLGHTQTLQPVDFLAQVASWSWVANLEDEQRAAVLGDVEAVVKDHDELTIPYRTDLYLTRRTTPSRASREAPVRRAPTGCRRGIDPDARVGCRSPSN